MPTKLKKLAGNPGKRPLGDREPNPELRLPEPPHHLSDEAKREWSRVGVVLVNLGMISELDRAALAAYCQAWSRWVEAEDALSQYGMVIKSPNGFPQQSPYLAIANKALEQMRAFLIEFGMTPASRTRLHIEVPAEKDPLDELREKRERQRQEREHQ